jgi:hypothetical protein
MAFENQQSKKIVLYEYDRPVDMTSDLLNYSAGIWQYTLTPGDITVTDDNSNTGYYGYNNLVFYNVQSVNVDGSQLIPVTSIAELYSQDGAFYYDYATTKIYIAFTDYEPPLNKQIYISAVVGFAYNTDVDMYFNGAYYDPRVSSIFGIKKSKDPLFYGLLKFESGTVKLINEDGNLDDWRSRNLYRQATRLLVGEAGNTYAQYSKVFTGIIGNDSRTWDSLSVKVEDVRAGLSTPVPYNKFTTTDYPDLADGNVDKMIPIAYGAIRNAPAFCLNENESGSPATYTFKFCDTEFNNATELTAAYVSGVSVSLSGSTIDLTAGTFTLTAAQVNDQFGDVTCDFTGANITNGVDIIKDLMLNYANTTYISALWDTTETDAAQAISRSTSLYIKDQIKLNKAIEKVCVDIDALFFAKDSGLYSIRIYDADRTPVKTIYKDEWTDEPQVDNNSDEFLTSCIIKYNKDQSNDEFYTYEETAYIDDAYAIYKSKQSKTIETGLTTESAATLKARTIMDRSKLVQDVVKRSTKFQNYDLEIMDFVICDPRCRVTGTEVPAVWEVIGINKDLTNFEIQLTLQYIKTYTPVVTTYSARVESEGDYRITSEGHTRIIGE